jgi:hypothetical protein
MSTSDRTQLKDVLVGSLGSLRSVSNAILCVSQDAQRFDGVAIGALTVNTTNYTWPLVRVDRPVQIIQARILPGGALVYNANAVTIAYGYTNDNQAVGSMTTMGFINTANTVANGGTANWAVGTSIVITANANVNAIVPSGSQLFMTSTIVSGGVIIPAGTVFQLLWEEV